MTLSVTFLGTSGSVPTPARNPSSLFVKREGTECLFDVGEGTQRQMMRFQTGFATDVIFLTHVHGDHVLGLPGLLQTMEFNDRTRPLPIYTPRGTETQIQELVTVLDSEPHFDVAIEPVAAGEVVYRGEEYRVETFPTDHDATSVGYALIEDERKGRFDRERAEELGVPPGPLFSELHEGNPVELDDGAIIQPEQVVGPPRPGRSIVYTGDTRNTDATVEVADEPDLLVHDATFADDCRDRAEQTAHATATDAGEIATRANAKRLALVHVSSRYAGDVQAHLSEAREAFDGDPDAVTVPNDGDTVTIPYPE